MKVVVQRSLQSKVEIGNKVVGSIEKGLVLLVGFHEEDTEEDISYLIKKIIHLRIFDDENGKMNDSIFDQRGEILSISQFTLYGDNRKGNRPSYVEAMKSEKANIFYNQFNEKLKEYVHVETGIFGENMKVSITNDGPVTIILESREKNDKK